MHIDNKELEMFQNETLNSQDMIAFLEHLESCDFCLNEMIHEEKTDVAAPAYLKAQILSKASSPEVQAAKAAAETSHKAQMLYYGLRTAVGVITALFLLFSVGSIDFSAMRAEHTVQIMQNKEPEVFQKGNHLYDFSREIGQGISKNTGSIANHLNIFSNKLLNGGK